LGYNPIFDMHVRIIMPQSAVIFDFDGVIADTEKLHLAAYNQAFARHAEEIGGVLEIGADAYFSRYVVYGNREGFLHMLRDAGRPHDGALIAVLCATKDRVFAEELHRFSDPLPGVRELLAWLEDRNIPRAICSGAIRSEILHLLEAFGLRHHFDVIVTIEDVRFGKPDPEGYNKAFERLNLEFDAELDKKKSLVIEDSAGGCAAGKAAGIPVLAVATSLPLAEVRRHADHAVADLGKLDFGELAGWLGI
jgi:beta-phosphoglucomutase